MGFSFIVGIFYWINVVQTFQFTSFVLLSIYLASYFGLFGVALNFIHERTRVSPIWIAPCVWVCVEYLRSQAGVLSLPWGFLGYSQFLNIPLIQISSFTGVYGISFLIVMVNAVLSEIVIQYAYAKQGYSRKKKDRLLMPGVVTIGLVLVSFLYGIYILMNPSEPETVRVAVIQGNIPQDLRWQPQLRERHLEKHMQLTRQAATSSQASLIVWPETAVQGSLTLNRPLLEPFTALTRDTGKYVLVGSAERPKFYAGDAQSQNAFNSAFLISPRGRIVGRYNKIRLLPFGEYLPYKQLPWPSSIASPWSAGEFAPGTEYTLLRIENFRFAVTICWENIFPDLFRRLVQRGANFTVNITNEAWFGETAAPYQFLGMSVLRAVENRISIARAANTGVSGFIDPFGRILGTVTAGNKDIFVEGFLAMDIPLSRTRTFYTKYGDLFAFTCAVVSLALILLSFGRGRAVA